MPKIRLTVSRPSLVLQSPKFRQSWAAEADVKLSRFNTLVHSYDEELVRLTPGPLSLLLTEIPAFRLLGCSKTER